MNKILNLLAGLLMSLTNTLTPTCEIISHKISKSLDSKISLYARFQIKLHLMGCVMCRLYRKQLLSVNKVFNTIGTTAQQDQIEKLPDEARQRMRQILTDKNKGQ